MKRASILLAAAGLALTPAGAAADAAPQHFRFALDPQYVTFDPCGATEVITGEVWGTVYPDRIINHFAWEGTITAPDGRTFSDDAHQTAIFTPSGVNTLDGQGMVFTIPGYGLVYQDVGHLVFNDTVPMDVSTIQASAKARGFDTPPDAIANAVCAALTG
jgi:hypothetical protein